MCLASPGHFSYPEKIRVAMLIILSQFAIAYNYHNVHFKYTPRMHWRSDSAPLPPALVAKTDTRNKATYYD